MANTASAENYRFENTNKWGTRTLVTMALLAAISVLLSFLETPPLFAGGFLKLDVSLTPAMVCGFAYGPTAGVLVGIVSAVVHGMFSGNWIGAAMNIIIAAAFIFPACAIYKRNHTIKGALAGLAVSIVCIVVAAIVANLIFTPYYLINDEVSHETALGIVQGLLLPAIVPFNVLKGVVNAALTMVVYKSVSNLITPRKSQVKGR